MSRFSFSRRDYLAMMGAGAALAATPAMAAGTDQDRARRMLWWHEAKFGMFIHWGLYSVLGRHEWAMEEEGIPVSEYEQLAKRFTPKPYPAREWAKLAKRAGMKYMVMTSKHHEGFCHFTTNTTDYCAPKQAAGRDLAKEFLEAARAEGLRAGFYYSLMDWHHPDGARSENDMEARERFLKYIHTHVREILTNYGKVDILWYDVAWPMKKPEGWESEKMNKMAFELQPDIIVNNRNLLDGDFQTPEQRIVASQGKAWEACMTMNDSWGYHKADDDWKTPKTVVRNVVTCARDGGNYLLNIGPKADGSIPEESVRILTSVGKWMDKNGQAVYGAEPCRVRSSNYCNFTRKGNTLFVHVHFWPGETVSIGGLKTKVLSAKFLASGKPIQFKQEQFRVQFTGLPAHPPDDPVTVLAVTCESEPTQDMNMIRRDRPRNKA